jgi:hypothetical protein
MLACGSPKATLGVQLESKGPPFHGLHNGWSLLLRAPHDWAFRCHVFGDMGSLGIILTRVVWRRLLIFPIRRRSSCFDLEQRKKEANVLDDFLEALYG